MPTNPRTMHKFIMHFATPSFTLPSKSLARKASRSLGLLSTSCPFSLLGTCNKRCSSLRHSLAKGQWIQVWFGNRLDTHRIATSGYLWHRCRVVILLGTEPSQTHSRRQRKSWRGTFSWRGTQHSNWQPPGSHISRWDPGQTTHLPLPQLPRLQHGISNDASPTGLSWRH